MMRAHFLIRSACCALGLLLASADPAQSQSNTQAWGYKVKPGDRLVDIAKTYQKNAEDWKKLQKENAVPDPKLLQPGKQINIPVPDLRQGDPSAEAVLVHGEVQRLDKMGKPEGQLSSGDVLKMGDTVRTGERSTLTIRFADGSRMLVTEKSKVTLNSLLNYGKTGMADSKVIVHEGGTDSQVSPQKGPAARYEVNTPAINLTVRGTEFRVQVDESGKGTRTEVVEGLVAGQADSSNALIGKGFGLVAQAGQALALPSKLLQAPSFSESSEILERMPVRFSWTEIEGAKNYRLQLLATVDGNDALIFDETLANVKVQWDELPDGDYVLRVRGIDGAGLEGINAVRPFQLRARPEPPVLNFPENQYSASEAKAFFRWNAAPDADTYVFQLAEDQGFKNVIAKIPQISALSRSVLLSVTEGTYFWRVASVTASGQMGPYSDPFMLSVRTASSARN
jgi:hypothetical protein